MIKDYSILKKEKVIFSKYVLYLHLKIWASVFNGYIFFSGGGDASYGIFFFWGGGGGIRG